MVCSGPTNIIRYMVALAKREAAGCIINSLNSVHIKTWGCFHPEWIFSECRVGSTSDKPKIGSLRQTHSLRFWILVSSRLLLIVEGPWGLWGASGSAGSPDWRTEKTKNSKKYLENGADAIWNISTCDILLKSLFSIHVVSAGAALTPLRKAVKSTEVI